MANANLQNQVQELLLLQRVAQRITALLDLDALLEEIVGDVSETFGYSRSAVLLKDPVADELVIAAVRGWTANYHCKGERFKIGSYGIVGHVGATGETYYAPDVLTDPYYEVSEPLTRSELDIPLKARGRLIGIFNVQHTEVKGFSPARIQVLEALAGYVGTAIDNAQMFQHERKERQRILAELEEAQSIQRSLLPENAPAAGNYSLSGICLPCRAVGGDWYDYILLADGRVAVVVADVSGKGMAAALLMSSTRSMVRLLAERAAEPGAVLGELNRVLLKDFPRARFVTMLYVLLDPKQNSALLASAGHPPPLLITNNKSCFVENESGFPLGIGAGAFQEQRIPFVRGARLVLYSDGVLEAANTEGQEYGTEGIQEHFSHPDSSVESLLSDVHRFTQGFPLEDDATAVAVELHAVS